MTLERKNEIWAMLPEDFKKYVQRCYNAVISNLEPTYYVFEDLFGTHNLTAQAEEKPKEPRFKIGDKVKVMVNTNTYPYGSIHTITELHSDLKQTDYLLEKSNTLWLDESSLDPYTEPKEEQNHENISSNNQNCTKPTENGISDSKIQPESAKSVEIGANYSNSFQNSTDWNKYRLDLAKEIAVALCAIEPNDDHFANSVIADAVDIANEIVKRLKEEEE